MKRIFTNLSIFQGFWLSSINENLKNFLKRLREYKERMRKAGIQPRLSLRATSYSDNSQGILVYQTI